MTAASEIETLHINADDIDWFDLSEMGDLSPIMNGRAEVKRIWEIPEQNRVFSLFRMWPGLVSNRHLHLGAVTGLTVSGTWHYLEYDWTAGPGSFIYEPAGSIHTLEVLGDEPVIAYFDLTGNVVNFGADGTILDAKTDEDRRAAEEADRIWREELARR
ncbi:2,4'-dihydroxyacetophenone dioxygenase family protein [Pseudonocardia sp. KRD-184]|uniref:2,4'-dihydroxyacetophenone dioxygenase family protein n=1 Tax=Pseudonocardia oceani TaxID=2792013 RepID=A0ABS6U596_9PSEU|nr:2,4'-dihydroxyacetophenone dioxygenase family protein [Pseudonocardia oceani]MBW0090702.1 2,4'-dihydroxyacetophenone dioxygenase family protein [Pseudonocardia oceani]MBW0097610.1 2,4'-dihydroxyacetophenone dioxygenase family protein [Pseudonocardia oceani]MBW0124333.1 2,4'-dihydroxyacetophenone dioxygenase family protein [Pseudonocardia oceani]MBW0127079.1 2,4'-dihydroxyacetophenone dioxygenase family protein [Pseudonocardia oceani]